MNENDDACVNLKDFELKPDGQHSLPPLNAAEYWRGEYWRYHLFENYIVCEFVYKSHKPQLSIELPFYGRYIHSNRLKMRHLNLCFKWASVKVRARPPSLLSVLLL